MRKHLLQNDLASLFCGPFFKKFPVRNPSIARAGPRQRGTGHCNHSMDTQGAGRLLAGSPGDARWAGPKDGDPRERPPAAYWPAQGARGWPGVSTQGDHGASRKASPGGRVGIKGWPSSVLAMDREPPSVAPVEPAGMPQFASASTPSSWGAKRLYRPIIGHICPIKIGCFFAEFPKKSPKNRQNSGVLAQKHIIAYPWRYEERCVLTFLVLNDGTSNSTNR